MVAIYISRGDYEKDPCLNAGDVWIDRPTPSGILIYSIITPFICLIGIVMNSFCFLVLWKKQWYCSFYVYLCVIATVDLVSCIVVFLSGLARGILWSYKGWISYDALISIPLGGFLGYMSTIATVFITIERVIYLKNPMRLHKPKFSNRKVALTIIFIGVIVSSLFALPYCFIFEFTNDYKLTVTEFYKSCAYAVFNWLNFAMFAILPLMVLSVGNSVLVKSLKRAYRMRCKGKLIKGATRRSTYQTKLTITLIAIVIFFMIGELPSHITARETATNILFGGDENKANRSLTLELSRQIVMLLNAFHLTIKFVLYCLFCPRFYDDFKTIVCRKCKNGEKTYHQNKQDSTELSIVSTNSCKTVEDYYKFDSNGSYIGFMNTFVTIRFFDGLPTKLN